MSAPIIYDVTVHLQFRILPDRLREEPPASVTLLLEPESRPSFSTLRSTIISLHVGTSISPTKTPTIFTVHKDLLCQSSLFFSHKFKPDTADTATADSATADSATFSDDFKTYDPDVFAKLIDWIYYGRLPEPLDTWWDPLRLDNRSSSGSSDDGYTTLLTQDSPYDRLLVHLYFYTMELKFPDLQHAIIRQIIAFANKTTWIPSLSTIEFATKLLPERPSLLRLFAEIYAVKVVPRWEDGVTDRQGEMLPARFLMLVAARVGRDWVGGTSLVMFEMDEMDETDEMDEMDEMGTGTS